MDTILPYHTLVIIDGKQVQVMDTVYVDDIIANNDLAIQSELATVVNDVTFFENQTQPSGTLAVGEVPEIRIYGWGYEGGGNQSYNSLSTVSVAEGNVITKDEYSYFRIGLDGSNRSPRMIITDINHIPEFTSNITHPELRIYAKTTGGKEHYIQFTAREEIAAIPSIIFHNASSVLSGYNLIGTANNDPLHLWLASDGPNQDNYLEIFVPNSGNPGLYSKTGVIRFLDVDDAAYNRNYLEIDTPFNGSYTSFYATGTEVMRLTNAGNVQILGDLQVDGGGALSFDQIITGDLAIDQGILDIDPDITTGTVLNIQYDNAKTLSGAIIGIDVDFVTNITLNDQTLTGLNIDLPATFGSGTEIGIHVTGDDRSVSIITDDHAIETSGDISITGNIAVTGTVDGVDIASLSSDVDGFPDELKNLVQAEIQQLENIDATTISAAQWTILGGLAATLTYTELNYVDGVTSAIQTQLDGKAATSHSMASHSDDDTYNINTSGTAAMGALTVTGSITISGNIISSASRNIQLNDAVADTLLTIENTDATYKANLDVEGNIVVGGTVDGRDIATDGTKLDGIESGATADQTKADIDALGLSHDSLVDVSTSDHHVKYALTDDLAAGEITQLQNIDSVTITNTQWGYLGALDQGLTTTSTPTFGNVSVNGYIVAIRTVEPQLQLQYDSTHYLNIWVNSSNVASIGVYGDTDILQLASGSITVNGNITVTGTVDGRDIATDGTKLDGIESGATADQTKAEIDALGLSHDSLVDVSTDDHHAKYTDAEARAAINDVLGSDGRLDATLYVDNHDISGIGAAYINDNGIGEGYMGPSAAWGLHHPEGAQGGYDAVEIKVDDPFQIRYGTTKIIEIDTSGNITTVGTVDGVDIAALKTDVDGFPDDLKNVTASAAELNILDGATVTTAEINYSDGVTSNIQTQINACVKDTGDETIAGVKTFSSFPVTPSAAPTTDYQVANKKYVDDTIPGNAGRDIYYEWVWLDPRLFSNTSTVGASTHSLPGFFQQTYANAVDNQYWYAVGYIRVPVGWKAKVVAYHAWAYQGNVDSALFWKEVNLRTTTYNFSTNTRTSTTILGPVSDPFTQSSLVQDYYNASITERWFYTYDDDPTQILDGIEIRYRVDKSASSNVIYLYSHAVKIKYERI